MLEKLGKDAVIYVQNENKFNELAGLQSDNPPKLLARVELVGDSLTDSSTESKPKLQTWDSAGSQVFYANSL